MWRKLKCLFGFHDWSLRKRWRGDVTMTTIFGVQTLENVRCGIDHCYCCRRFRRFVVSDEDKLLVCETYRELPGEHRD